MKKTEFKSLIKECVRECLKEIIAEQINPAAIQESLGITKTKKLINPMDDEQMVMRDKLLQNRPKVMQEELSRQSNRQSMSNSIHPEAGRYTSNKSGYLNPSDRLKMAADRPTNRQYSNQQPVQEQRREVIESSRGQFEAPSADVLRNIFEDTMKTTLPQQEAANETIAADKFALKVANSNPDELFTGSKNWEHFAFDK
jgi:hypothetical protein